MTTDRDAPEPLTPEPWEVAETLVMEARRYRGTLAKVTKQDWLMIAAAVVLADRERASMTAERAARAGSIDAERLARAMIETGPDYPYLDGGKSAREWAVAITAEYAKEDGRG